jgi:hypothetical protein
MRRILLLACFALVTAGCASGADVAEDSAASPDSAVIDVLEGAAPNPDSQPDGTQTP